jgi:hypothetical protein
MAAIGTFQAVPGLGAGGGQWYGYIEMPWGERLIQGPCATHAAVVIGQHKLMLETWQRIKHELDEACTIDRLLAYVAEQTANKAREGRRPG